ncbi:MAG: glycosyltransferase family 4 protein [Pseudomonadota bacterium]
MNISENLSVLLIANHYRDDHASKMSSYRNLDKRASSWNKSLINELMNFNINLNIICFYPIYRPYVIHEGNTTFYYLPKIPILSSRTSLLTRLFVKIISVFIKPDIIHGIGSEHGYTYSAIKNNIPAIITIHGYLNEISKVDNQSYSINNRLIREESSSVRHADAVIAINQYMKNMLINNGVNEEKIIIIPNPINLIFQNNCANKSKKIDLLMVGTFSKLKNYHLAIQILEILKDEYNISPSLYIAGMPTKQSEQYYSDINKKIKDYKFDNVHLLGILDQNQLKDHYCKSRFLLHLSSFETDSLVVSEAMECACIPIVNNVSNLKYKVTDSVNGYHINIDNLRESAKTIYQLLTSDYSTIYKNHQVNHIRYISTIDIARKTFELYKAINKKAI